VEGLSSSGRTGRTHWGDRHFIPQVSVRSPLKLKFWRSPLHPTSFSAIAPPSHSQNSRWMRSPLQLRWVAGEEAIALLFQSFSFWMVRGGVVRLAIAPGLKQCNGRVQRRQHPLPPHRYFQTARCNTVV